MSTRNLDRIFRPERIAVVGGSERQGSVGNTVMRNLLESQYSGSVHPVNPKYESVHGRRAVAAIDQLDEQPDLAIICTPARTVPSIVEQCDRAGVGGVVILSAGFREIGDEGKALEEALARGAHDFRALRAIGPNCLGVIAPWLDLNASFAAAMPPRGQVAFVSQSGALCTSVLDWAREEGIGFSYFVSIGNMLDVDFADLIDYFARDRHTESIVLYIESISDARKFMSASRAFTSGKPIVAYKAGRFTESAQAAASHTGAMAGEDAVFDAAFRRAGIERVLEVGEIFDCAELLARYQRTAAPKLAIITNAGGPGVMATDALLARRGVLADLSDETIRRLDDCLPGHWSGGNPVDVLGDASAARYEEATRIVLDDDGVDAALVILTPQAMTEPVATARAIGRLAQQWREPVLAAWMGGGTVTEAIRTLNEQGIPTYRTPEDAVHAFMHLVSYRRNRELLYETPRDIPVRLTLDYQQVEATFRQVTRRAHQQPILSEADSKRLLAAYGIPVNETVEAGSADEAVRAAERLGFPVVLKILSPQITHKTDVGGIALDLRDASQVREAYERVVHRARQHKPEAEIDGVTVQPMVAAEHGIELILGAKQDATFGSVMLVGLGGTAAEVLEDRALALPPLSERLATQLLESLRGWPLLEGYRGQPGVDLHQLIETFVRLSYLVADHPQIDSLDINPLLAASDRIVALDARVVIEPGRLDQSVPPYPHLAIRPYPKTMFQETTLEDGTAVVLRPIRPEDEPRWLEFLQSCSAESIRARFGYTFEEPTHEMAIRYCFIDYDREMALVAEIEEADRRPLIGVGRLVIGPDPASAEYSVLVADAWQGRGLGLKLTNYCAQIAEQWGIQQIEARTDSANARMIATFRAAGFAIEEHQSRGVVRVRKTVRRLR